MVIDTNKNTCELLAGDVYIERIIICVIVML